MPIVSLLMLGLLVFAVVDAIMRPGDQVRFLPKAVWVLVIILMPLLGSILWFTIGRTYGPPRPAPWREHTDQRPAQSRPVPRAMVEPARTDSRSTEQQIADLDREIEEWRLRAEVEKRKQQGGSPDAG